MSVIKIATRASKLALAQTNIVAVKLKELYGLDSEIIKITSEGDKITGSLAKHGGKGLFCCALESILAEGRVDVAVHSLKDMPPFEAKNLKIAAVLPRADSRDVLVTVNGASIDELPRGAKIGTSSARRKSALLEMRRDLQVELCRGNVQTRLDKLHNNEYDGIVLAKAGLDRLALSPNMVPFDFDQMLPASTQGIIAIQACSDSTWLSKLDKLNCPRTFIVASIERKVCHLLNGNCTSAIGVHAVWVNDDILVHAIVYDQRGKFIKAHIQGNANVVAEQVANKLLSLGAADMLKA